MSIVFGNIKDRFAVGNSWLLVTPWGRERQNVVANGVAPRCPQ
jgi:hypothetical protein